MNVFDDTLILEDEVLDDSHLVESEITVLTHTNIAVIQKAPKAHPKKRNSQSGSGSGVVSSQQQGTVKKKFFCAVLNCPYSTPYAKDLTRHNRKHTGEKPYGCDRCQKSFSRYDKLRMHIRIHDGDRPYKCSVCDYAAVDSGSLKKHIRTHTDERPYKCQVCPYSAKDSSQLVVHLRYHTGDTPYVCMQDGCDAAFKTPSDLQRHSRLHTGEKPYACELCDYKAAVKCNLKTHLKKYHKIASQNSGKCATVDGTIDNDQLSSTAEIPSKVEENNIESSECTVITKPKRTPRTTKGKINLPFHFACKLCPFKGDTMKSFAFHMRRVHSETGSDGIEFNQSKVPAKKRKSAQAHSAQIFECSICPAAFVREDSLRCHMRQHSDPTLHPPMPVFPLDKVPTITENSSVKGTPTFPTIPVSIANLKDYSPPITTVYQIVAGESSKIAAIRTEVITYNQTVANPNLDT